MFNIALKYFMFYNNTPPANWVAYVKGTFLGVISVCIIVPWFHEYTKIQDIVARVGFHVL